MEMRAILVNDGQLRWQCRRGMRELDQLLLRFLENEYPASGEAQKLAFRELLALPDPELIGYLLGGQIPLDSKIANVVSHIQNRAGT
jgi:antitoxin CptB